MNKKTFSAVLCLFMMLTFIVGCAGAQSQQITPKANTGSELSVPQGISDPTPASTEIAPKQVIATTYAAYDWAKNIAKDSANINVSYLVDSNVDLHSYQPSAEDIVKYKTADLVICVGGESEEWIEDLGLDDSKLLTLMDSVEKKEEELIEGMQEEEHEHDHEHEEEAEEDHEHEEDPEYDEHIWLSVKNAQNCADAICTFFGALDPANATLYINNAEVFKNKLSDINKKYEEAVTNAKTKTLLFGDRFPFRYMVDDYGLTYYAAFIGCSAETEASFETIKFLADKVDELGLKNICVISSDHTIADTIINNTKTKDQNIIEFDSMQSISNAEADNISYLEIMDKNADVLKTALQ